MIPNPRGPGLPRGLLSGSPGGFITRLLGGDTRRTLEGGERELQYSHIPRCPNPCRATKLSGHAVSWSLAEVSDLSRRICQSVEKGTDTDKCKLFIQIKLPMPFPGLKM